MNQKQKPVGEASLTPRCDELERQRRALEQGRTAAYGDALALARRLEIELSVYIHKIVPCKECGHDTNTWGEKHFPHCKSEIPF